VTSDRRPKITRPSGREQAPGGASQPVRVRLLDGFEVRVGSRTIEGDAWRLPRFTTVAYDGGRVARGASGR
jgi:hypothetical protein